MIAAGKNGLNDEAVAFSASDPGGPERNYDPASRQRSPRTDMAVSSLSVRRERSYLLPNSRVGTGCFSKSNHRSAASLLGQGGEAVGTKVIGAQAQ